MATKNSSFASKAIGLAKEKAIKETYQFKGVTTMGIAKAGELKEKKLGAIIKPKQ